MMKRDELPGDEYGKFYAGYVGLVPSDMTLLDALEDSAERMEDYLKTVPPEKEDYAYAEGKWTVKECLQHLIDSERVFGYRMLRLGRHDATPLPGYDQDEFAAAAKVENPSLRQLAEEFMVLRNTTRMLASGLDAEDLAYIGSVSESRMSARAMGFIICGHTYHHINLYRERY